MTEEPSYTPTKTDEFKSEFTFTLRKPIPWVNAGTDGTQQFAKELVLKAPSNRQRHQTAALSQGFMQAVHSMQDKAKAEAAKVEDKADKDHQIKGTEVLSAVMMSDIDFVAYQETFRTLLLNDIAFVSDGQKLTSPMYDNMSTEDSQNLMGEYIAIFLISSLMRNLQ